MRIHSPQITGSAANTNIILTTVTSSISVLSASFASTASYWSGSIINAASASYWSGSIINAATASYILNAVSASYVLNAISSSFASTASFANNFTVGGTLTAQTINVQTITSSIDYVTGSSINGSLLSNTHQFTGSTSITGSLTVNNSNVILANQTSSMSVATASYALNVPVTASYANNSDLLDGKDSTIFATTGSNVFVGDQTVTGSISILDVGSSLVIEGNAFDQSSFSSPNGAIILTPGLYGVQINGANPDLTVNGNITNTGANSSLTGSLFGTASYALQANSASYALTASYLNPITNSYVILSQVSQSLNFVDDDAAAAGGVPLGGLYRNGNFILIRVGGSPGLFSGTVVMGYSNNCQADVPGTFAVTGNGTTFCNSTELTNATFTGIPSNISLYISYGGQTYSVLTNGSTTLTVTSTCSSCP